MCHCVKTFQNLVRGRGKFNVCEEIISLQFTVHDTSHHICKHWVSEKTTKGKEGFQGKLVVLVEGFAR